MVERVVAHQCGLMKQAPPLRRTFWCWRGVRVGEALNPGPVETRSARRSAVASDWDDESGPLAVAEPAQTNGDCSRRAVRGDSVRRPKRLRIQMRPPSPHIDVPASILDALEADLQTIPASTVPASSRALAFHDPPFVTSAASTVPASSAAVRGMHVVPVVSMSEGSERASDNQSDGEAPIDEEGGASDDAESFGRESDLESVVPSEGSTVSLEEPVIRPAASARGFVIGLAQLDAFTLTTIFERRAHVMRVVPHVMRAAFSSAIRVACEEIVDGFSADDIIRQERAWKLLFLLPRMLLCRPRRGGRVPRKELEQRLAFFNEGELARVGFVQHSHG